MPWHYVLADAAVSDTLACRTGYTLAKTIVERRDEFGVTWFLIDDLSRLSRNTIESLRHGELAEATGVRVVGASDGYDSANPQSSLLLPVLGSMNEAFITQLRSKVKRGMDDAFRRGDNIQPPGVGYRLVEVKDAHGNLVITHKNTIEKVVEIDPEAADWTRRGADSFGRKAKDRRKKIHRVDLYPKVLIRPIGGCCGNPMILGKSVGKYQSFFCFNATNGIRGCTNKGYKSARIIDEAVLRTVMATLFTDGFITDLTAEVNKRLTDRLAKLDDTHLDTVLAKAEEMGRQLAAKQEQLKELQRAGRRPSVKSVKEKDMVASLGKLRDLLQGDVGVAAQVLRALVGDVVLELRQVEGQKKPQMVARFTINAVPALAVLERGRPTDRDVAPASVRDSIHSSPTAEPATVAGPAEAIIPLIYDRRAAATRLSKKSRLVSPRRGFYLILRPEDRVLGAPDPARWIDPLMKHVGLDYRISLLRAAAFHGSAHQAAMVFQVVAPRQLPPIEIGRQRVEFLFHAPQTFARSNHPEWLSRLKTEAGFAKIAGVELTLLDICRYFHRAGGINGAAQAAHDLGRKANARILAEAAVACENTSVRRLGYLLERFGHARQARALRPFAVKAKSFTALDPSIKHLLPQKAMANERIPDWKLIVNTAVEIDE